MPVLDDYVVGARRDRRPHADVYDAVHRYSGAAFLVYVLRPRAMADRALVHRVGCEIDAARWIRHPAVPTLDAPGTTPSRRLYVAVEHRAAASLRTILALRGGLPAHELVGLVAPLVDALEQAHAVGLVHGRLTPDAIGVCMTNGELTATNVVLHGLGLGSIASAGDFGADERPFISPEQLAAGDGDARSDVYGLAAVVDFALHGDAALTNAATGFDAPAGARLAAVLRTARAHDPRDRPASVRVFWDELLRALVAGAYAPAASTVATLSAPVGRTRWRRVAPRASAGLLVLPLLAAFGWPLARGGARAAAPLQTRIAGGESIAAAPAVAASAPAQRAAPALALPPQIAERPLPSRSLAPAAERVKPAAVPTPAALATPATPLAADPRGPAASNAPAALGASVPTFIIIDASAQAQNAPRPVGRPGEFEDGLPRTRRPR